ncbi:hypothetical protein [Streptomyces sp. NPDC101165]|uniref:hypothetical protein n=1 Tax=Streptomyces sp. NPDC101165 TaxID=3366119 RepID=UPI0037FF5945
MTALVQAMKTALATSTTQPVRNPGRAYDVAIPKIGRNAASTAGVCQPAYTAKVRMPMPMPMPVLVLVAVLDAAIAIPPRTPNERRIVVSEGVVPGVTVLTACSVVIEGV